MKINKPNITEGEWKYINPNDELGICLVNTEDEQTIHDGFDMSNAKAISAVPYMIDELICTHRILNHQLESLKWLQNQNVNIGKWAENQRELIEARLRNNEKALTKAGCTYE